MEDPRFMNLQKVNVEFNERHPPLFEIWGKLPLVHGRGVLKLSV